MVPYMIHSLTNTEADGQTPIETSNGDNNAEESKSKEGVMDSPVKRAREPSAENIKDEHEDGEKKIKTNESSNPSSCTAPLVSDSTVAEFLSNYSDFQLPFSWMDNLCSCDACVKVGIFFFF